MNNPLFYLKEKCIFPSLFHDQLIECVEQCNPSMTVSSIGMLGRTLHISFSQSWMTCCTLTYREEFIYWHFFDNEKALGGMCHFDDPLPDILRARIEYLAGCGSP